MTLVKTACDRFCTVMLITKSDVQFWQSFLKNSLENLKKQEQQHSFYFQGIFSVHDDNIALNTSYLKVLELLYEINRKNADDRVKEYLNAIKCLYIVRIYNEVELLLVRTIAATYYPSFKDPLESKKEFNKVTKEIAKELTSAGLSLDRRNNKYVIDFLRMKSMDFNTWVRRKILSHTTTVEDFFKFASIVRHIVAHQGLSIPNDIENILKSVGKDIYETYFSPIILADGEKILHFKHEDAFMQYSSLMSHFAVNTTKFIAGNGDLSFLGFQLPGVGAERFPLVK